MILLKFLKFCIVGGSGIFVDFGITFLFREKVKMNQYIANSLGFISAATTNYMLNRYWTFVSQDTQITRQYFMFVGVAAIGLLINNLIIYGLINKFKINFYISKILAIGVVTIWNFLMSFFIVFTH